MLIDGLKAILETELDLKVIGFSTNPETSIELIEELNPNVILSDINMPKMDGLMFVQALKKKKISIPVLIMSMQVDSDQLTDLLDAEIQGYILKNAGKIELVTAIRKLAEGSVYFSSEVTQMMINTSKSSRIKEQNEIKLTEREKQIIRLIAQELTNAQIGDQLFISERTVESHRKNIFRKTKKNSVVGLIKYAIEQKII